LIVIKLLEILLQNPDLLCDKGEQFAERLAFVYVSNPMD
jgi:hypothetical protein